jgi:hypothetical protein
VGQILLGGKLRGRAFAGLDVPTDSAGRECLGIELFRAALDQVRQAASIRPTRPQPGGSRCRRRCREVR